MHTCEGDQVTFSHNSGFDGDILIHCDLDCVEERGVPNKVTVKIPFDDIKTLAAKYVRNQLISKLEDIEDDGIDDGVYFPLGPQPAMIKLENLWISTDQIATVSIPFSLVTLKDGSKYTMPKGGWKEVIDNMRVPQTIHLD